MERAGILAQSGSEVGESLKGFPVTSAALFYGPTAEG